MKVLSYCNKGTVFPERPAGILIYLKIFWSPDDNEASCNFWSHKVLCLSWLFQNNYSPRSKCSFLDLQDSSFDLLHARNVSVLLQNRFSAQCFHRQWYQILPCFLCSDLTWAFLFVSLKKSKSSDLLKTAILWKCINNQFKILTKLLLISTIFK